MIFIVCGGRDFREAERMLEALDVLHAQMPCTLLITGGARGADELASRWGKARGIDQIIVPANWEGRGQAAGPRRNAHMMQVAHLLADTTGQEVHLIAFPGGKGTADMCRKARAAGVQVIEPMGESAHVG